MNNIFEQIIKWNKERKIPCNFGIKAEYSKLEEELIELKTADGDSDLQVDALCDLIVVATGGIWKLGYDPTLALEETLKEISSRSGSFNVETGKWEKVLTGEEYQANYEVCKV